MHSYCKVWIPMNSVGDMVCTSNISKNKKREKLEQFWQFFDKLKNNLMFYSVIYMARTRSEDKKTDGQTDGIVKIYIPPIHGGYLR